jgi:hypothetical protein
MPPLKRYVLKNLISNDQENERNKVKEFFSKKGTETSRVIRQSIEAIHTNANWLETNRDSVKQWLDRINGNR